MTDQDKIIEDMSEAEALLDSLSSDGGYSTRDVELVAEALAKARAAERERAAAHVNVVKERWWFSEWSEISAADLERVAQAILQGSSPPSA